VGVASTLCADWLELEWAWSLSDFVSFVWFLDQMLPEKRSWGSKRITKLRAFLSVYADQSFAGLLALLCIPKYDRVLQLCGKM